ncbi:MAG TPA: flagellar basal body L-ring protein FlgH [Bacillota bacterium]
MKQWARLGITLVMVSLVICGLATVVRADSLWPGENASLYADRPRQYRVGDLLTIIVQEQATASQNAESSNGEKGKVSTGGLGKWQSVFPLFGSDWNSSYEGEGETTRRGSLTAKLTVEVKEVYPNGILALEGHQVIRVNAEDQILTIKGKVRSEDVSEDNIVMSSKVADAVIEYQGRGTVGEAQKPGILTRFFHWLF